MGISTMIEKAAARRGCAAAALPSFTTTLTGTRTRSLGCRARRAAAECRRRAVAAVHVDTIWNVKAVHSNVTELGDMPFVPRRPSCKPTAREGGDDKWEARDLKKERRPLITCARDPDDIVAHSRADADGNDPNLDYAREVLERP